MMISHAKKIWLLFGILIPAAGGLSCGRSGPVPERAKPVQVRAVRAASTQEARIVDGVGSVHAGREAVLSGKVMGTVTGIRKQAGDPIRRGEILVVVDSRDVTGQINQAQGALAQAQAAAVLAETNYHRFEALYQKGAASQLEFDQARYQHETAKGAVQQAVGALATARSYSSYAEIPAPFDGRVVDRMIEVGDMAGPGMPLMKVEDAARLRLYVTLSEADLGVATQGKAVRVRVPSLGDRMLEGTVAEIVPAVDPATRSFLVKIDLPPEPGLRSGLYGHALFAGAVRPALRVPRTAVRIRGGLTGVFVAEDGHATFRLVTTASLESDPVEILTGLSEGDEILVSPPATLEEGAPVEVQS